MNCSWIPAHETAHLTVDICMEDVRFDEHKAMFELAKKLSAAVGALAADGAENIEIAYTNFVHQEHNPDGKIGTFNITASRGSKK